MRISNVEIARYGPIRGFSHECEDNIEVFFGPNESGKTLLLESVLKLFSPDIDTVFPDVSRVSQQPSGHIYVETTTTEEQLGGDRYLDDISDISVNHLRNIFVVRDGDLELRDEHAFYDSVTQRIGDLHTNEIQAIQDRLVETGRLTSLRGRGLSSAKNRDNAGQVLSSADDLASDIRKYIAEVEEADLASAEREHLAVTAELQRCEEELATQEDAATMDRYDTLSERLADYRTAVDSISETYSRDTLEELRGLDRASERANDAIDRLTDRREELRSEIREFQSDLEEVTAQLSPLEDRSDAVADVIQAREEFREAHSDAVGANRGMAIAKYVAIGGVGLGGLAAVLGSTIAGVLLTIIGAISLVWYWVQHRSLRVAEQERDELLEMGRDAGLEIDAVDEIGTAIREFEDRLQSLQEHRDSISNSITLNERQVEELDEQLESERDTRKTNMEMIREKLSSADVNDVEEYRQRVDDHEEMINQRDRAEQSLVDSLNEPDAASPEAKIDYWEAELAAVIADVDDAVTADMYDEARLDELRREREQLTQRRNQLRKQLEEHTKRISEFADRLHHLQSQPFIGEQITLESRSTAGLRGVIPQLENVIEAIERDADVAREALDIFDELKAEEEQKITDLFGPESRATEVFNRITGSRYDEVSYDTDEHVLTVRRDGGDVFTVDQLSRGTKTQLYLAARVGLAEQLLGSESGFFLMDDAFLPADGTRLREGFDILQELAEDGWQILYFTAKDEVGEDIVEVRDLTCRDLRALE